MPLLDWSVPFNLTSTVYTNNPIPGSTSPAPLPINTAIPGLGIFYLRQDGCALNNTVRSTKDFVPQADGAILHRRFLGGMEMELAIQLWETTDMPACDALGQEMLDVLMGYLYGLLNAGDNEGRLSWTPTGQSVRMLEDIRLLSYPAESHSNGIMELVFTVDTSYPYTANETQLAPSMVGGGTAVNLGNRPTYPVWQIYASAFTIAMGTQSFSFNDAQPGCPNVTGYVEIDTFRNTTTIVNGLTLLNGAAGVVMASSEYFLIPPGSHAITNTSGAANSRALINAAWA